MYKKITAALLCLYLLLLVGCFNDSADVNSTQTSNVGTESYDTTSSEPLSSEPASTPESSENVSDVSSNDVVSSESNDKTVYLVADKNGDLVNVKMMVKNNPGIAAFTVRINYEKDKVTAKSITSSLLGFISNLQQPNANPNGTVTAVYGNLKGTETDGELFNITFMINEAATGNTSFVIDCDADDFVTPDGTYINFHLQSITVSLT